jgi:DNA-binding beta-propeller fold protein YncE
MAGTHQLWSLSLDDNTLTPSVGNGREAALNSSLANSELAQPSGLFYTGGLLYFADSESSTVRVADFNTNEVRLVSGTADNNLFDFGDIEGPPGVSRLQHALGVTGDDNGLIYIADTYNSRIKTFDPATGETRVLLGLGGEGGFRDGGLDVAEFDEPGGLDYADGRLYVADTNNHTIRVIDLETQAVSTVMFPNAEVLALADEVLILGGNSAEGLTIRLDPQSLATGDGEIVLHLTLPEDYKINTLIDSTLTLGSDTGTVMVSQEPEANALTRVVTETEVHIPATFAPGEGSLSADLTLYYCREDNEGLCFIDNSLIEAPVVVGDSGEGSLVINRDIQLPELPDTSGF